MQILRGIKVPLKADTVLSPEVRYAPKTGTTRLVFPINHEEEYVGRVTFESLDSIRCCRGESPPYERAGDTDRSHYPWVWEVENSAWLQERHEYEFENYHTSLLEEFTHYFFQFHDEFVEVIAKGIWFEKVKSDQVDNEPPDHPLMDLPESSPTENFVVEGISCSVRHNPLTAEGLLERSKFCSQTLFQYFMILDGEISASYVAKLRTLRGRSITRLREYLFEANLFIDGTLLTMRGVGQEAQARKTFEQHVGQTAAGRRQRGKSGHRT